MHGFENTNSELLTIQAVHMHAYKSNKLYSHVFNKV